MALVYFICKLLSVTSPCLRAHAATVSMRQEPILYSGGCGNECFRLMAQRECGMDELAVEWLLRSWKTVASGDTSTAAAGSVYLQGGGRI